MWRYLVGALGMALLGAAILVITGRPPTPQALLPGASALTATGQSTTADPGSAAPPEASAKTREERRFGRYDKDRSGAITREEYLAPRRKAFARLDANGDGALSFDEWAVKTTTRFADADSDHNGAMSAAEFATTAPKRSASAKPKCACPAAPPEAAPDEN